MPVALAVGFGLAMIGDGGWTGLRSPAGGWLSLIGLMMALVIFVLMRAWRRLTLTFDEQALVVTSRWGPPRVLRVADIARLGRLQLGDSIQHIRVERRDGSNVNLQLICGELDPALLALLHAVAQRTGLHWHGLDQPKMSFFRLDAAAFWRALRRASGSRTNRQTVQWLLVRTLLVTPQEIGINSIFLGWTNRLLVLIYMLLSVVFVLVAKHDQWPALALAITLMALINLCLNIVFVLIRSEVLEREALGSEMASARTVQEQLMPAARIALPWLDVAGRCVPARAVGGDLFQHVALGEDRVFVAVADVAGKGLPAALLGALVKGALDTALRSGDSDLRAAAQAVAQQVRAADAGRARSRRRFLTLALVGIDQAGQEVQLLRAGHLPPLLVPADAPTRWLEPRGVALGLFADPRIEQRNALDSAPFGTGDRLVLYSDGVTEASGADGEQYGEARLQAVVESHRTADASALRDAIFDDVIAFAGRRNADAGSPAALQDDDVTVVVIERLTPRPAG